MKAKWLLVAIGVVAIGIGPGSAQSKRSRATKEFMREKLELSQKVLEGVTTEQWELVIGKGARLSAMTQEADWTAFENPKYDEQTRFFKQHVDSLVKAAKRKDVDAATLAYVRMTMSCVDCHKLVRGKIVASIR
jgi:hypothetical protein